MLYQIIIIRPGEPCDHLICVERTPEAAQRTKGIIESRCKVSVRISEAAE